MSAGGVPLFFQHLQRKVLPEALRRRHHLVVAHGLLGSNTNWNTASNMALARDVPTADGLVAGPTDIFHVDMRNHGRSPHTAEHVPAGMASDLERMVVEHPALNTTAEDRVVLVGHSMGGIAAMHALIRNANERYYGACSASTAEEQQIQDEMAAIADLQAAQMPSRPLYSKPGGGGRVVGAIIVDIAPMTARSGDQLTIVDAAIQQMLEVPLAEVRSTRDGDAALKSAGCDSLPMRQFLLTNLDTSTTPARWRCNLDVLHRDIGRMMAPDLPPREVQGMRRAAEVPVHFVFGGRSPYFGTRARVEAMIDRYFDPSVVQMTVLDNCDHYPHFQAPGRFNDAVQPFLERCFMSP